MSDLNRYYDNFPDDRSERKKRKNAVYSSKDFIPGAKGVLVKLFVSMIMFLISTSFITFVLTHFMPIGEMLFIAYFSAVMMLVSWGISVLLKSKKNIFRLLAVIVFIGGAYLFSPYDLLLTVIVLAFNMIISFAAIKRLNLPEKLALTQPLLLVSCIFFCFYQLFMTLNPNITEFTIEAKPLFMTVGIIWIIVCVFVLNFMSLSRVASGKKLSKGLIRGNIAMTVILTGLILIISNVGAYKDFILGVIRKIFAFIFNSSEPEEIPMESEAPQGGGFDLSQLGGENKSSAFWDFMEKVLYVLLFIILAVLLFYIIKKLIKVFSALFGRAMSYLKSSDAPESILAFEDKEESVFDKGQFNTALKKRWERMVKRFTRKPKFSDMKDNRAKARFIYKHILRSNEKKETPVNSATTAREYFADKKIALENMKFVGGYEKARYSKHDVTDDEVAAGLGVTGKLK